ncbi:hypothetical protein J4573_26840 [Actinomadura barringtoniae]|uniref:Clp R domain-containing protein n=1 Tax=Actinomadura barringtoniae TaxID=1427535 RepID=A0A939PJ33_9ACTN|nr:hypothetical protein [Actinomadura barringtoniae]
MRLAEGARRALGLALQESTSSRPGRIGTDHLLFGLLAGGGVAAEMLAVHGATTERVRSTRRQLASVCIAAAPRASVQRHRLAVRWCCRRNWWW